MTKPFYRAWQRDALASAHDRGHGERAEDISARKKLIHAVSPNADRPINRAMVAGCRIARNQAPGVYA
jgi:hypothetical protein